MEEKERLDNAEAQETLDPTDAAHLGADSTEQPSSDAAHADNTTPDADNDAEETDKTAALEAQNAELKDKYLRLAAEFENYKRRTSKERLELLDTAARETVVALLPVLDDFDRAVALNERVEDLDALKDGFKLIQQRFIQILDRRGLKAMDTTGKPFDADFQQSVTEIPMGEEMKGKVVDTVEKGYTLNSKIIRFAKVVVGG